MSEAFCVLPAMRTRRRNSLVFALYVNAALLLAVLLTLWARGSEPALAASALGQVQPAVAGGAGLFVVPAQFSSNSWGCYLLDVDSQTLCAYQYFPGERNLHLVAARNFKYDRQLGDFNTQPSPDEIEDLVRKAHQRTAAPTGNPQPSTNPGTTGD
jgi:hypothetical protein